MVVVMTVLERGKGIEFHHGGRGGWCGGIALALGGAALLLVSLGRDPVRLKDLLVVTLSRYVVSHDGGGAYAEWRLRAEVEGYLRWELSEKEEDVAGGQDANSMYVQYSVEKARGKRERKAEV